MTIFREGMRVRILWSVGWPELAGQEGTIVKKCRSPMCTSSGPSEALYDAWNVAPDIWGTHVAPHPCRDGFQLFGPFEEQLAPLYDGYHKISWEFMKNLWTPDKTKHSITPSKEGATT